jgi:hypothetical protein
MTRTYQRKIRTTDTTKTHEKTPSLKTPPIQPTPWPKRPDDFPTLVRQRVISPGNDNEQLLHANECEDPESSP